MHDLIRLGQVEPVRKRLSEATLGLLGCTIALSDDEWRAPSLLPGWSRAHVATHVARNADALRGLVQEVIAGGWKTLYASEAERMEAIERGAERSGLELQIDLDTSAGELSSVMEQVDDWAQPVRLPFGVLPLASVAVARLHEVTLHHIDLGCSYTPEQLDPVPARWLLQWAVDRLATRPGLPAVDVESDSGLTASLGDVGERRHVRGTDAALWGWVTGRSAGADLDGVDGHAWPPMP